MSRGHGQCRRSELCAATCNRRSSVSRTDAHVCNISRGQAGFHGSKLATLMFAMHVVHTLRDFALPRVGFADKRVDPSWRGCEAETIAAHKGWQTHQGGLADPPTVTQSLKESWRSRFLQHVGLISSVTRSPPVADPLEGNCPSRATALFFSTQVKLFPDPQGHDVPEKVLAVAAVFAAVCAVQDAEAPRRQEPGIPSQFMVASAASRRSCHWGLWDSRLPPLQAVKTQLRLRSPASLHAPGRSGVCNQAAQSAWCLRLLVRANHLRASAKGFMHRAVPCRRCRALHATRHDRGWIGWSCFVTRHHLASGRVLTSSRDSSLSLSLFLSLDVQRFDEHWPIHISEPQRPS